MRLKNNDKYIYHGTNIGAAISMQHSGKMHSISASKKISFTSDYKVARYYSIMKGHRPVILRIIRTEDFKLEDKFEKNNGFEWVTLREIPVNEIEVETKDGWIPLKSWDFIDNKVLEMKYLKSYKLFESNNKKIYYHGRDTKRRPYNGDYIYLTDNMGFAATFSDMKKLYTYTLNFSENEIFSLTNIEHRKLLKDNIDKYAYNSIVESSDIEMDWSALNNIENDEFESGEDLLQSLGFKGVKLRERPTIYSILVFEEKNVDLVNTIDLTTPKMIDFMGKWFENPGFNVI